MRALLFLGDMFFRIFVKSFFIRNGAEVIGMPLVFRCSRAVSGVISIPHTGSLYGTAIIFSFHITINVFVFIVVMLPSIYQANSEIGIFQA
jgi:type III secretory pathway component EscR